MLDSSSGWVFVDREGEMQSECKTIRAETKTRGKTGGKESAKLGVAYSGDTRGGKRDVTLTEQISFNCVFKEEIEDVLHRF